MAPLDLLFVRPMPAPRRARSRWVAPAAVAAVTAVAALLRLGSLGAQSFSPPEVEYALGAAPFWDPHALLLGLVASAFGASDLALRAPSAIAGAASVPVLYALVRALAGRGVGLAAAALLAIAPLHVAASQDARPFAPALLAVLVAALALLHAAGRDRVSGLAARAQALWTSRRLVAVAACGLLVPVAAAALASAAVRPEKADWRGAVAEIESRIRAEDLLLFDGDRSEAGFLRYALRADARLRADAAGTEALADALAGRRRAWLVLDDARSERAIRRALPGWREADRVYARGVQAVLLER